MNPLTMTTTSQVASATLPQQEVGPPAYPSSIPEQLYNLQLPQDLPFKKEALDYTYFMKAVSSIWKAYGNVLPKGVVPEWTSIHKAAIEGYKHNQDYFDPNTSVISTHRAAPGTAKSTCSFVLMAMAGVQGIGGLLVVEEIDSVENATAMVNFLASKMGALEPVAVAKHSRVKDKESLPMLMRERPIVVTTHAHYANCLLRANELKTKTLDELLGYGTSGQGQRTLNLIDECFDFVDAHSLDPDHLQLLFSVLEKAVGLQQQVPMAEFFESMKVVVEALVDRAADREKTRLAEETTSHFERVFQADLKVADDIQHKIRPLITADVCRAYAQMHKKRGVIRLDPSEVRSTTNATLKAIEAMVRCRSYISKTGMGSPTISAPVSMLSKEHVGSCLILDGTSHIDPTYCAIGADNHGGHFRRRFDGTRIFIAHRGHPNRASFHTNNGGTNYAKQVLDGVQQQLPPNRDVLVVTAKNTDHYFIDRHERDPYFKSLKTATWGAGTSGSNEFRGCDTVVVATLPFRPQVWAANYLASVRGLDDALEAFREGASVDSEVAQMVEGKALADVVQAIFRTRMRQVTDGDGISLPVDVFLVLPTLQTQWNTKAKRMRESIINEFPGAEVLEWQGMVGKPGKPPLPGTKDLEDAMWTWIEERDSFTTKDLKAAFNISDALWKSRWRLKLSPAAKVSTELNNRLKETHTAHTRGPTLTWTRMTTSHS